MSKSNWKGTSGWTAKSDPTGVLSGKTLVATAGLTSQSEDYLQQLPGSTVPFTETNYSVLMNYGWPVGSGLHPLSMGELGLIARASNFVSGSIIAYDAYVGKFNIETGKISIVRRLKNTETTLIEADVPSDVVGKGSKHVMEFKCFGTNPVTLQFSVDNTLFCSYGDSSGSLLASGYPGIRIKSGTCYIDNFSVVKYTVTGAKATEWNPSNAATGLAAWYKADVGVTQAANAISAWADQSGNANNLVQADGPKKPIYIPNFAITLPIVSFTLSTQFLSAADSASLDITSGITMFALMVPPTMTTPAERVIAQKGGTPNYELSLSSTNKIEYQTSTTDASTTGIRINAMQIVSVVSGSAFYLNGLSVGSTTAANGVANTDPLTIQFKDGKVGEIIIYNGVLSADDRQRVEGYLAHKWKISSLLPTSHPYRGYAPLT